MCPESGFPDCSKLAINLKNDNGVTIWHHDVIIKFCWSFLCLLWILFAGSSFLSRSALVLELWQFSFIREWSEIRKSEIPPSEFCPISGDWGVSGYQILPECLSNEMLLNSAKYQGYSFYRFLCVKGIPTGELILPTPVLSSPPRLALKIRS